MSGQKKRKTSFAEILDNARDDGAKRMASKVPEWAGVEGLSFPTSLCTEQCSSSATAWYKAGLAERIMGRAGNIADLTGGLGVDSWAFSHVAARVLHNEMNRALHDAVKSNFAILGRTNIDTACAVLESGTLGAILDGFTPDLLFIDPARRNSSGRKVFLLEDCSPDILGLMDELTGTCGDILVKISPMADITMVARRLGSLLKEVHVTGSGGECKELLLWLHKGNTGPYTVTVAECLEGHDSRTMTFSPSEEAAAEATFLNGIEDIRDKYLFEPGSTLSKSGCHNLLSGRYGMSKLGRFTHLYICSQVPDEIRPFGKVRRVMESSPLGNSSIRDTGRRYPRCEVTARNIPMTSEALRTKMGVASGSGAHIYGVTVDLEDGKSGRYLIVTDC